MTVNIPLFWIKILITIRPVLPLKNICLFCSLVASTQYQREEYLGGGIKSMILGF